MSGLEIVVREFYRRMGEGDYAGVVDLVAEDIEWTIPGPPSIPYAGTFRGKHGLREFLRILERHEDLQCFTPREFIVDESDGKVCVLGSETAVALDTGKAFSTQWAEVFTLRNGLIVAFEEHIDTYALAEAYGP